MANEQNLKPFTGADDPRRGKKPKGTKHISTWIQQMLNDEEFETVLMDSKKGAVEYKGAPLKAIIKTAMHKAIHDPKTGQQWAEWLAKHGYGNTLNLKTDDPIKLIIDKYGGAGKVDDLQEPEATKS